MSDLARGSAVEAAAAAEDTGGGTRLRGLSIPVLAACALAGLAALPQAEKSEGLRTSILGASALLLAWTAFVFLRARSLRRSLAVELALKSQHYLQACAQGSVLVYWSLYWPPLHVFAPLIVAQLLFAYGFDALLSWSRRDTYSLGFAPFPVVFSINLFLWFKADWFYLQFAMVAVGMTAKELVRWTKDGRRAHVFNPSSFPLALFSLALIATGSTSMTYGTQIAVTLLRAPGIYVFLFAIGLVGQYLFGVTTMTMSAAVTMFGLGLLHRVVTGETFFREEYIPVAVFLGMLLLFTDPSTAPKTELGRILFGVLYAVSVMACERLLAALHAPGFYDKLLPVPLMNLTIRAIDRLARTPSLARLDPGRLGATWAPRRRNLAYVVVWALVFGAMNAAGGLGPRILEDTSETSSPRPASAETSPPRPASAETSPPRPGQGGEVFCRGTLDSSRSKGVALPFDRRLHTGWLQSLPFDWRLRRGRVSSCPIRAAPGGRAGRREPSWAASPRSGWTTARRR
jgi:hypothetical protein